MGYTHYLTVDKSKFLDSKVELYKALEDIKRIVRHKKEELEFIIHDNSVYFNAIKKEDQCENFYFGLDKLSKFQFVKTRQRAYDYIVVACYARLNEIDGISFTTDGDSSDLEDGVSLAEQLGIDLTETKEKIKLMKEREEIDPEILLDELNKEKLRIESKASIKNICLAGSDSYCYVFKVICGLPERDVPYKKDIQEFYVRWDKQANEILFNKLIRQDEVYIEYEKRLEQFHERFYTHSWFNNLINVDLKEKIQKEINNDYL